MLRPNPLVPLAALAIASPSPTSGQDKNHAGRADLVQPGETRFGAMRQLTFEGENAEAYWAFDGASLIFQSSPVPGEGCDQIYTLDPVTGARALVSTGKGRTTCAYFYPAGDRILYSSTHHHDPTCPTPPDRSRGYVWALFPTYDIVAADAETPVEFDAAAATAGWNDLGEFTLPAGEVALFVSNRTTGSFVVADAVRWRPVGR